MDGFDFAIDDIGEILIDSNNGDIAQTQDDMLRIQLAFVRLKSCINEWFYDEIGANLEELLGRAMISPTIDTGKERILEVLTFDDLWDEKDIFIQNTILDETQLIYTVYFRLYTDDEFGETTYTIIVNLDLVKGVKIKFGWNR